MDESTLRDALEAKADTRTARARGRDLQPLKGIRGVSDGDLARVAAAVWKAHPPDLDDDRGALDRTFGAAFEDGIVAIGLVAAAMPDAPEAAWDIGTAWLRRVDDPITADTLGWLILGPAMLAARHTVADLLDALPEDPHVTARRAVVSAGLAWTGEQLQGPAAAPLRERVGERKLRLVEATLSDALAPLFDAFLRDEAPMIRKALRRVLRAWVRGDPGGVVAWADQVRGGLPRMLREEVDRARRKAGKPV